MGISGGGYAASTSYIVAAAQYANPVVTIKGGDMVIEDGADLKLGDQSLKKFIEDVSERLNILQPNIKIEGEWEELRALGELYRAKEREILEKIKVWEALKKDY